MQRVRLVGLGVDKEESIASAVAEGDGSAA
jgi:hypothetical protein